MDISLGLLDTNSTFVDPLLRRLNSRLDSTVLASAVQSIADASNSGISENDASSQQVQRELVTNRILEALLTGTESEDTLGLSFFDLESLNTGNVPLENSLQREVSQANQNLFQLIANTSFSENSGNSLFSEAVFSETDLESGSAVSGNVFSSASGTELIQLTLDFEAEEEAALDEARLAEYRLQDKEDFSLLEEESAFINQLLFEQIFFRNITQAFFFDDSVDSVA